MVVTISSIALLYLASLVFPAAGAPTRSHCRCVVIDANKPPSSSSALRDTSRRYDVCAQLGPELEYFQLAEPDVYQTYFQHIIDERPTATPTEDELKPLTTTVLMELAAKNRLDHSDIALPSAPTERPRERIICRSESEAFTEYHDSRTTLFSLGVIVVMAVLACIAECINLLMSWMESRQARRAPVRLSGGEKKLRAYSAPDQKCNAPEVHACTAYLVELDDDDEWNVPV
ncbi:hypothetical protein K469DRAFT_716848, partial [Zopfia rhizophila CBS 207.26]